MGRRHENKDGEKEGGGGRDSWMAALYALEKEMFSKWLDESFREVVTLEEERGRTSRGEKSSFSIIDHQAIKRVYMMH